MKMNTKPEVVALIKTNMTTPKQEAIYRNAYDAKIAAWIYLCKCACKSGKKFADAKITYKLASTQLLKLQVQQTQALITAGVVM